MNNWKDKIREVTNVCYCHHNSGKELADEIIPIVTSLLEEQKKELREIVMKRFYSFNDKEKDFQCNQRVLKLRNTIQEDFNKLNK